MKTKIRETLVQTYSISLTKLKARLTSYVLPLMLIGAAGIANAETSDLDDQPDEEESTLIESDKVVENLANPSLGSCQRLSWSYDKPKARPQSSASSNKFSYFPPYYPYPYPYPYPVPHQDVYTWYCQARPEGDTKFEYTSYHSYDRNRLNARTFAISRCREDYDHCTARCALAPRICEPHFWP